MSTGLRSPKLTKAVRHAIREVRLAHEFVPNSYTASAFNAVLAVEQVYLRAAERSAQYVDYHHDTTSNHPTTNRARTP